MPPAPRGPRAGDGYELGRWRVFPSLVQMTDGEETVRLEPKVMDLLDYLARRPMAVVSKDEILDAVWPDTVIADDALHRYVSKLRQCLGDDPREPRYIETIPKRGYRLIAPVSFDDPPAVNAGDDDAPGERRRAGSRPGPRRLLPWAVAALAIGIALASHWRRGESLDPAPSPVVAPTPAVAPSSDPRAFELYIQSLQYARDGVPNQTAIEILEQVVELDPDFAPAWESLSERLYYSSTYYKGGQPALDRSLAASRRASELDPELRSAATRQAAMLVENGRLLAGYDAARKLLEEYPHRAEAHFTLSYVYRYGGLLEEAGRECDVALSISPYNYRFRSCAVVFIRQGNFARAPDFIRLDQSSEVGLYHQGYLYFHQGRVEDAQRFWRRLPEGSWASGLLEACRERPASPDTRAFLQHVRPTGVTDPEAWYFVAQVMNACGQPAMALDLLSVAVEKGYCAASAFETERLFGNLSELEGWASARERAVSCRDAFAAHVAEHPAPLWPTD